MKTLLRIDSSIFSERSFSKKAADYIEENWLKQNPNGKVIHRDLETSPISHLTAPTVYAFFNPEGHNSNLSLSDELLLELKSCDEILISSPVYNFAISSNLKAYIDHIVRINESYTYGENGSRIGLITDKKAYIAVARGGKPINGNPPDETENYLKTVLNYIGIQDIITFTIYGTIFDDAQKQVNQTFEKINNYFNQNQTVA